uniref:G protein-coupled receptor n=1 Tax=Globodera rostochiensis TaxID=31243 RepID=A0A914IAM0_GLORO
MVNSIRSIVHSFDWVAFVFGISLNGILTRLILRHTPKIMQIYSKILLQTCLVDVLVNVTGLLFNSYYIVTRNGAHEVFLDGLFTLQGTAEHRIWALLGFVCLTFLLNVSILGYVTQFIYRYLALNWYEHEDDNWVLLFCRVVNNRLRHYIYVGFSYAQIYEGAIKNNNFFTTSSAND